MEHYDGLEPEFQKEITGRLIERLGHNAFLKRPSKKEQEEAAGQAESNQQG